MLTEYAAVDVGSCGSCIDHNSLLLFLIINNPINIVTHPSPFSLCEALVCLLVLIMCLQCSRIYMDFQYSKD